MHRDVIAMAVTALRVIAQQQPGSVSRVAWAISHGTIALAVHAALGLALAVMTIAVAVRAVMLRTGWVAVTSVLGAMLVVGAGFNGASFLDFGQNFSSLLMALLALGALCCYLTGVYLLSPASP